MLPYDKLFIILGIVLISVGILLSTKGYKLPGDISIKGEHFQLYFPLATCLLISLVLSFLYYLFGKK